MPFADHAFPRIRAISWAPPASACVCKSAMVGFTASVMVQSAQKAKDVRIAADRMTAGGIENEEGCQDDRPLEEPAKRLKTLGAEVECYEREHC